MTYFLWFGTVSTVILCKQAVEATLCNLTLSTTAIYAPLGTRVTLTCRVCDVSNTTELRYRKDGHQIAAYMYLSGNESVTDKGAFSLDVQTETNNVTMLTLTIKSFTTTAEGNYTCDRTNPEQSSSLVIAYTVPVTMVTLTPAQQIVSVLENKELSNIQCSTTQGKPVPTITWYLDKGTPSDYSDDQDITDKSTYTISDNRTSSVLTFTPTALDQDKRIYCNTSNGYGPVSSDKLKLNILVPPEKPKLQFRTCSQELRPLDGILKVTQGTNVYVTCTATSNPLPAITWKPNPQGASSTLLVSNVSPLQSGKYECMAENIMDTNTNTGVIIGRNSSSFQLEVLVPPQMCESRNHTAVQNQSIFLPCLCQENKTFTTYSWSKSGSNLTSSYPTLHIFKANSLHAGSYKCVVSYTLEPTYCQQEIRHVETLFNVRVIRPPSIPRQVRIVNNSITGTSVTIVWELVLEDQGISKTMILWSKQIINQWNTVAVLPSLTHFTIQGLESGTTYNVKIFASNEAGDSNETDIVQITTIALPNDGKMVGMDVILGSSIGSAIILIIISIVLTLAVVRCKSKGNPQPKEQQRPFSNTYDELAAPSTNLEQYEDFGTEKTTDQLKTMETPFRTKASITMCKSAQEKTTSTPDYKQRTIRPLPLPTSELEDDYINMLPGI
ncbi:hemicentin-1-like isoform X2 [Dreissena polymorpha]|uniref:hemicentin-1-like isoform X2 n=1 Tax=Dreissena polymorpha TaxID=45954 RepID=UPI00226408C0|nr:hemicentin-1-like isoform X2 [Dreissena polymorpha]